MPLQNAEFNLVTLSPPTDDASFSPVDPLLAWRGRQLANKLLQRPRGCGRLVIHWRGHRLLDKLEFLLLSSPLSSVLARRFFMYKLPNRHGKKFSGEGEKYLLLEKGSEQWVNGKGSVNESTGALGRTVGQLYSYNKVRTSHTVKFFLSPLQFSFELLPLDFDANQWASSHV